MNLLEAQGITIRRIRLDNNLSLRAVSRKSGIALGYISQIERAERNSTTLTIESIIQSLDITTVQYLQELAWTYQGKRKKEADE